MKNILYISAALFSLVLGVFLYQHFFSLKLPQNALYYTEPKEIKPFLFTDHDGASFNKASLADKWTFVFFGYTSCPDICPTTLQKLSFMYDKLKKIDPNSQVVLMTVDPARDTQEKLAMYIAYFNDEFKAVRGEHDQLFPFSRQLGLMYAIRDKGEDDYYLVDHSASIALVNPNGQLAAVFKPKFIEGEPPIIDSDEILIDYADIVALFK